MNYDGKRFKVVSSSNNGETSQETVFEYNQNGNVLTSEYSGGSVKIGYLTGLVSEDGIIDMSYHQVNLKDEIMTGICKSTPEVLPNGKIKLHEHWQWTSGDKSKGNSILEEV